MITFTENALNELRRQAEGLTGACAVIRLGLKPGGCAGTTYELEFPGTVQPGDETCPQAEFTLVVEPADWNLLRGVEVDFLDSLMNGGFRFKNPNADSSCGCGSSFRPLHQL